MKTFADMRQPEKNLFDKLGIDYQRYVTYPGVCKATNRFTGQTFDTSFFIAWLVDWVYKTSNSYERGERSVAVNDFDRVRYFILHYAPEVYSGCID